MIVERAGGGRHDAQVEVHLTAVEGDLRAWAAPPRTWLPNGVWDARADRASPASGYSRSRIQVVECGVAARPVRPRPLAAFTPCSQLRDSCCV